MKTLKMVFTAFACILITAGFSQNNEKSNSDKPAKRKLKIVDASVSLGGVSQQSPIGTFTDFQMLHPQSVLLNGNMNGYTVSKGTGDMGGPAFGANLGIVRADKENANSKSSTQLRIGVSFSGINISNELNKTDSKRYDTLTSSQTGQTFYSDSITYRKYTMSYKSQQVRLDLSIIYRTNPAARWSVYGGIGIEAGETIMAYTDIDYTEKNRIKPAGTASSGSTNNADIFRTERVINKNGFGYCAYLPIGIDFRAGTKREFFKQLHFFYEARPFLNNINIPELGSISGVGVKIGLGLRVTI